ncbi:MAG TPA: hypothetical protein GX405_08975 [Rhizobiales bacterium]|nr:hypothetical protein [Hyphomicrobiales bacterium]
MRRLAAWLVSRRGAEVALGLVLLATVRSIGEFFRLGGGAGATTTAEQAFYLEAAFAAGCAALLVLALLMLGRSGWATLVAGAALVALIAWKAGAAT